MRHVSVVAFLLVALASPTFAQEEDTLEWFKDYPKAIAEAKRTNKPIFLEFRCEA
jgi:hypothetical protein